MNGRCEPLPVQGCKEEVRRFCGFLCWRTCRLMPTGMPTVTLRR